METENALRETLLRGDSKYIFTSLVHEAWEWKVGNEEDGCD